MLMSNSDKEATIILSIGIAIVLILDIIVVLNFFTNDNIIEDTIKGETAATLYDESSLLVHNPEMELNQVEKMSNTVIAQKITIGETENQLEEKVAIPTSRSIRVEGAVTEIKEEERLEDKKEEKIEEKIEEKKEQKKEERKEEKKEEKEKVETKKEKTSSTTYQGFTTIGRIEIPKIGVDVPILSNVTIDGMEIAPCLLYSTGDLNESGNNVIVAHNYSNLFGNNKKLQNGDKIYITTNEGKRVEYEVYKKYTALSEEFGYAKRDTNNKPEITLSTCTEDDDYRLIIFAKVTT